MAASDVVAEAISAMYLLRSRSGSSTEQKRLGYLETHPGADPQQYLVGGQLSRSPRWKLAVASQATPYAGLLVITCA